MEIILYEYKEDAENPKWNEAARTHDWRNYVTSDIRNIWHGISLSGRCAIVSICQHTADNEE